jgi:SnoaL-like domain
MASHSTSSVQETADRLAIGELIDAYAHCADRRDAKGQMNLFTDDTRFVVYRDAIADQPTQELRGREALAPGIRRIEYLRCHLPVVVRRASADGRLDRDTAFLGLTRGPRTPRRALSRLLFLPVRILG